MDFSLMLLPRYVQTFQEEPRLPAEVGSAWGMCGIMVVLVLEGFEFKSYLHHV